MEDSVDRGECEMREKFTKRDAILTAVGFGLMALSWLMVSF